MINYDCTRRRNKIVIAPGGRFDSLHTAEAVQKYALGTELELDDATGRKFRYAKNSSVAALAPHLMGCSSLIDAEQIGQIQTAYGVLVGEHVFDILAATGHEITDGELKDGWLHINDGSTAMGDLYLITDNKFVTDDTVITIELAEPLRNAILVTDDVSFIKNEYLDIIVKTTAKTTAGRAIGVPRCTVAKSYFYWAQYKGLCSMIVDAGDTIIVNEPVGCPGTYGTPGAVGLVANDGTDEVWGTLVSTPTASEAAIVRLNLP